MSSSALLLEVEEETAEEDIKEFDSMWWEIRKELDGYLQASQEHVRATQAAAQMLQNYAAKCAAGFSEMKRAYSLSVRAETHAHKILKRAWAAVSTGVAEMASKVADGVILDHLAVHDLHSLNPKAMLSKMNGTEIQVFCDGSIDAAFTVVRKAAAEAMKKGLYGQTHRQLMVLFEDPCHNSYSMFFLPEENHLNLFVELHYLRHPWKFHGGVGHFLLGAEEGYAIQLLDQILKDLKRPCS